jgi:2-polyprenyl-3-methyl-5-hydroxy-6-metoxy-1,4-benzoquinol methylase
MAEYRLFPEGTIPEYTTPAWYAERERAPHLEQGAHQGRLHLTAAMIRAAQPATVVDLGAGDGGLLSLIRDIPAWGYDLQPSNLAGARERGVDVRYGDVVEGDIDWGELAVVTECLEHLLRPHQFVKRIAEHAKWIVASSPWTETDQSAYEFHTFAWDHDGYRALIEQAGFEVVRHETADMFQVICGVRP